MELSFCGDGTYDEAGPILNKVSLMETTQCWELNFL